LQGLQIEDFGRGRMLELVFVQRGSAVSEYLAGREKGSVGGRALENGFEQLPLTVNFRVRVFPGWMRMIVIH
jgi:hypothetical protein